MTALSTAVTRRGGVFAEILVARRVQQVEGEPLMLEAHHRRGDRDAAFALDRHPVRAHPPPFAARLDLAGELDRPAKQQQFFGQGGLAGVRVRDSLRGARSSYPLSNATRIARQPQPSSFMAHPAFQILVMCRILSPAKSMT
jgi:hypothetical protein